MDTATHPTTIRGRPVQEYAKEFSHKAIGKQLSFLEEIIRNFGEQIAQDESNKKYKLAEETSYFRENMVQLSTMNQKKYPLLPLNEEEREEAHLTANLRYDKLIEFLETYKEQTSITQSSHLDEALIHIHNAWNITPLSWKKQYAPETIKK